MPLRLEMPKEPEIVFGVWNRYGEPYSEFNYGEATPGFQIVPRYYSSGRTYRTRPEAQHHLQQEANHFQRIKRSRMLRELRRHLRSLLQDREITGITSITYNGLEFNLGGEGGSIRTSFTRRYWQTPTITLPEGEGPMVVKLMYATEKRIRLTDGRFIEMSYFGKLQVDNVPDWMLEEVYGTA